MAYIEYYIFDFVKHWTIEDKKYIASCCYNLCRIYRNLDDNEKLQIILSKVLRSYRKYGKELKANNNLVGILKYELSNNNRKVYSQNIKNVSNNELDLLAENQNFSELSMELILNDLKKILPKAHIHIIKKKLKGEPLTNVERVYLSRIKDKIYEYIKL